MRTYNPHEPLISLHIPKCAGTSLNRLLRIWFKDGFFPHYFRPQRQQLPPRRTFSAPAWRRLLLRQQYRARVCIHGHFDNKAGTGVSDYYPQARQFITVLRDPFEIAISLYFYGKSQGEARIINGQVLPMNKQFRDCVDFFERAALHRPDMVVNYLPGEVTLDNYARILESQFVYVGIAEDMQTSADQLSRKLGFAPQRIERRNAAPRDEPILPGMREAFIETHPLEYALYNYALERYTH